MHHETKIIICTKMKQKEDFNPHILCTSKHSRPTRTSHGTKHLVQSVNQASRHTHRINPTQKRRLAFSIVFPLEFEPLVFRLRKCLVNVRDFLFFGSVYNRNDRNIEYLIYMRIHTSCILLSNNGMKFRPCEADDDGETFLY